MLGSRFNAIKVCVCACLEIESASVYNHLDPFLFGVCILCVHSARGCAEEWPDCIHLVTI